MHAVPDMERIRGERLILALVVSLAVHFAIVVGIQGKSRELGGTSPGVITAHLEPAASANASVAVPDEQPSQLETQAPPAEDSAAREQASPSQPADAPQPALKPEPRETSAVLEVPVIRDPTYYAMRLLDEYPQPLAPIEPRYPEQALHAKINGSVTLLLLIDENGMLQDISVVEAKPESIFNEAALEAFREMRFSPARKDGRVVRSRVLITVGFEASNPRSSAR